MNVKSVEEPLVIHLLMDGPASSGVNVQKRVNQMKPKKLDEMYKYYKERKKSSLFGKQLLDIMLMCVFGLIALYAFMQIATHDMLGMMGGLLFSLGVLWLLFEDSYKIAKEINKIR